MNLDWIPIQNLANSRLARDPEIGNAVLSVIRSGTWLHGTELTKLEAKLSHVLNVNFVKGVGCGTDAIYLALRATGCSKDSIVVTAPNAGGYTSTAARMIGAQIAFCDVREDCLTLDASKLDEVLHYFQNVNQKIFVVATHLFGNSVDLSAIQEVCEKYGAILIEDCAQSFGGKQNDQFLGSFGEASAFSFYPTKNLGAAGDAGAVVTNSETVAKRVTMLREYGWSTRFNAEIPGGINSRLDEVQAKILMILLEDFDARNANRKRILTRYRESITLTDKMRFVNSSSPSDVCHIAVLMFATQQLRDKFRLFARRKHIETAIHYPNLDYSQVGLDVECVPFNCRVAEDSVSRICTIPLYPELTNSEIDRVSTLLMEFSPEKVSASGIEND